MHWVYNVHFVPLRNFGEKHFFLRQIFRATNTDNEDGNSCYMFRASSAHLQEDTVVHVQHMVLSLSMRVLDGLSVHSLSEN